MAHNHGYEYQIRIVHEDGIEELSGWMNSSGAGCSDDDCGSQTTRRNLLASGHGMLSVPTARVANRFWNIPLWTSRLHDASRTTPVICRWWNRKTGTLWAFQHQVIGLESAINLKLPVSGSRDFGHGSARFS